MWPLVRGSLDTTGIGPLSKLVELTVLLNELDLLTGLFVM